MESIEFERTVLRLLYERGEPLTSTDVAYAADLPVKSTERMLARLVEDGVLLVRIGRGDVAVYDVPGRRRRGAAAAAVPPPGDARPAPSAAAEDLAPSPLKAVLLSVVVPGAGHIYAGRSGAGAAWMACTLAGYACFFLPGLFLHGLCLVSAAHTART